MRTASGTGTAEDLWQRWTRDRDPAARDQLVVHYAPLVKFVVGRLRARLPAHVDGDDLVSDGILGLIDAVDRFDPTRGHQFPTFAVPRVRGAVLDGLRGADEVSRQSRRRMRLVERVGEELTHHLGRSPSDTEVARELGLAEADVHRARADRTAAATVPVEDHLEDAALVTAGLPEDTDVPAGLASAVRSLPERDQVLIALYYWERLSMAEVAQVLGVTESRVSQLHTRATQRLADALQDSESG